MSVIINILGTNARGNGAAKVLARVLSNDTPNSSITPRCVYNGAHHHLKGRPPLSLLPHHPRLPEPPTLGRVLCAVLVIIQWAGPPSIIEFHSIDKNHYRKAAVVREQCCNVKQNRTIVISLEAGIRLVAQNGQLSVPPPPTKTYGIK